MDLETLRKKLQQKVQHKTQWDKYVTILSERETQYSVLFWKYDCHEVKARSKDTNLLLLLKECIEMYLEETEE